MNVNDKLNWVYEQLEDEESRYIFEKRRLYNETMDYTHIWDIVDRCVPQFAGVHFDPEKPNDLVDKLSKNDKVAIWGAGVRGRKIYNLLKDNEVEVVCFCDNNEDKRKVKIDNKPILSFDEFRELNGWGECIILVTPVYGWTDISEQLISGGVNKDNIWDIKKFMNGGGITIGEQYFARDIISFEENEVFVDGGCYDMGSSKLFLQEMKLKGGSCKKIYAFELNDKNYVSCKKNASSVIEEVELINAGLWSKDTYLRFADLGGSSYVLESDTPEKDSVAGRMIDSCITEKVTFIKMDVEGAELEALKGARKTIMRDHPKLAICIYHKPEDIWEIPCYIKSLVPEYKLYIRHYSNYHCETVLYATL